jgi:aryl-alcohol dehydrogenase-like predicted oxidoreductase
MEQDFLHTTLGCTGRPIFRVGLSASYRPGVRAVRRALDEGVNLLFCYGFDSQMTAVIREIPASTRGDITIVTGAYNLIWGYPNLRKSLERRLRQLRTDYIDVFLFLGVMKPEQMPTDVFEQLTRLKEEGKVKAIGLSTHHRPFAGELARTGKADVLMIRYNAAHRGAEREIFPHLQPRNPGLLSYTSTRWTSLTRRPKGWPRDRQIPDPSMAYRFVLSNPHVHACVMAPSNEQQLEENLKGIRRGPLNDEDMQTMREFGDLIYSTSRSMFSFADLRQLRHRR